MRKLTLIAVALLIAGSAAVAQDFGFSAQFRERSEFSGKMLTAGQSMDVFHLLRSRLAANVAVNEDLMMMFEVQDARTMGSESSLMNQGAPAFDLRQGFIRAENMWNTVFDAKLGRMVLSYANERLIGAVDWSNFGQSFDGGVASANFRNLRIDVIGASVSRNVNSPIYTRDEFLTGLWGVWSPTADQNSVQPFFLYNNPIGADGRIRRFTAGVYTNWLFNSLDIEFDGAYQFGEFPGTQVSATNDAAIALAAYMVGIRAGYTLEDAANLRIGVGLDLLSGNAAPDEGQDEETIEAFSTMYATNHKFYGHMDYFPGFQNSGSNLGLMDIIVQLSINRGHSHEVGLDFHLLSTAVDPKDFLPANSTSTMETALGMELDLWYTCEIAKALWATVGFSMFDRADSDKLPPSNISPGMIKTTKWGWVEIMVNI